jgi:N-acetylglucosaminyldiphosphoundecaprenol N-acetyl-beta-D-mannosaminyltransferase
MRYFHKTQNQFHCPVVNVDKLVKAQHDPELRRIINECALINADGMPVVWACRIQGTPVKGRVAGSDLMRSLPAAAAAAGRSVYFLGGDPGAGEAARNRAMSSCGV